jgi:hypothetical protein
MTRRFTGKRKQKRRLIHSKFISSGSHILYWEFTSRPRASSEANEQTCELVKTGIQLLSAVHG